MTSLITVTTLLPQGYYSPGSVTFSYSPPEEDHLVLFHGTSASCCETIAADGFSQEAASRPENFKGIGSGSYDGVGFNFYGKERSEDAVGFAETKWASRLSPGCDVSLGVLVCEVPRGCCLPGRCQKHVWVVPHEHANKIKIQAVYSWTLQKLK
jgi:hypothetical protein